MKYHRKFENPLEHLADANARVQVFGDLEKGLGLIKKTCRFPAGSNERRLVKLIGNAVFYVAVRQLDGFRDFLDEMAKIDAPVPKKRKKRA